jgi:hypothetical protein
MNIDDRSLHKLYLIISRVGRDKSTFYALTTRFLVKYMHGPNPQQGGHSSSRYMLQDIENLSFYSFTYCQEPTFSTDIVTNPTEPASKLSLYYHPLCYMMRRS